MINNSDSTKYLLGQIADLNKAIAINRKHNGELALRCHTFRRALQDILKKSTGSMTPALMLYEIHDNVEIVLDNDEATVRMQSIAEVFPEKVTSLKAGKFYWTRSRGIGKWHIVFCNGLYVSFAEMTYKSVKISDLNMDEYDWILIPELE
jgi:hypothetical protein